MQDKTYLHLSIHSFIHSRMLYEVIASMYTCMHDESAVL